MASLHKALLETVQKLAKRLDEESRRFCPHMPRLKIEMEGEKANFILSNLDRVDCQCNFKGVCKQTVVSRCLAGRHQLSELRLLYESYNKSRITNIYETTEIKGLSVSLPSDFLEIYETFVRELYDRLGIQA